MKTHSKVLHLSVLLLVLQARCAWGVEIPTGAPARVGDAGDPARLSIEGAQTFTEGDIRRALQSDLDYLVASHPEATVSECLAALEARVRAGYRDCGFPDVVVQARFELPAGRIVAKVTEGPRFRCGALQVTGLKSIPVADFTRRFAEKLAPPSDQTSPAPGIWKTGMPATFTADSLANYSAAASNTFAALGRFAAQFKVEIQPQPAGTNAALAVIVADEGPVAVLRDIEVVGNQKSGRDDVISFLGLNKGMKVTQDLIDEKALALTQAARFVDSSITPTVPGPDGQVSLHIKVVENGTLPPLKQSLSREERTLLRLREWLLAWESRPDDLIIDWSLPTATGKKPQRIEVIVAPSGGIMARVMRNAPGAEKLQDLYSLVIRPEALTLVAQMDQRKLRMPLPSGWSGAAFVKLGPAANSPSGFGLTMGAGLSPGKTNMGLQLHLDLLPAALTDLLYRDGTKATWQGNVLTVRTESFVVRVDEGTGRLLEAESIDGKPTSGAGASDDYHLTVRFTAGAFAKAADQIAARKSTYPDAYRSQRAFGSALGFIAAELAMAKPLWSSAPGGPPPGPQTALASALEKLLAGSFLDPLQRLLDGAAASRSDDEFTIPSKPMKNQDEVKQAIERVMVWCAGHAKEITPADSWLESLLRESAFTLNSRTEHAQAALARLAAADDLGPIGCYAALHALRTGNGDSWAVFPELGLSRLTPTHFSRDYRMLLSPGSVISECLANLARELGALTPPEVEAIAETLPPNSAALVREMASATRQAKDQPAMDAIGPALDRWWETTEKWSVEADFRFHSQQLARAKSGQPLPQIELTGEPLRPAMAIPPRPANATPEMVDLTEFYDAALGESWHPNSTGNDLARLPSGVQEMQGVRFDIRGIVQLNGGGASDKKGQPYPRRVQGIKIGRKCARFHFLHSAGWAVDDGTVVGRYIIRYADGSSQTLPIVYGEDVRDWWVGPDKVVDLKNAQVAWQGEATNGNAVRIYQRSWENPAPDREVASLEFISTMTRCAPFLLAITTEP